MYEKLQPLLKEHFGFDTFKGDQRAIIASILQGNDVFVLMPTGGGKSLCYQLPAVISSGCAIVISPLIALMKNQVDAIRALSSSDAIAHVMNSTLTKGQLEIVKEDICSGRTKLLYVAPESFVRGDTPAFLSQINISFYAIDEAHCISEWGHDFRPDYRKLRETINGIGRRPIVALTATATPKVQHDIKRNLGLIEAKIFRSSFNRDNLFYRVLPKTDSVDSEIVRFILTQKGKSGIVYCMSRKKVTTFAELLQVNGIKALPYHAGLDGKMRTANQDAFLSEECEVIVATIAFGMGIDKPDIRFVVHYDMPKSLEGYYQETGRAGRDGGEGVCIAYYCEEDLQRLEKFVQNKPINEQATSKRLLYETKAYANSSVCRRRFLLHYFGEEYNEDNCGHCDNCTMAKKRIDASEWLKTILEAISELKQQVKSDHLIDVITGNATSDVENYGHVDTESFGIGSGTDKEIWQEVLEQAIVGGYLEKGIDNYGILTLTAKGKRFMKKPGKFEIVVEPDGNEGDDDISPKGDDSGEAADSQLFTMLRELRRKVAKRRNVAPTAIYSDASLKAMATFYPRTKDELLATPGVNALEGKNDKDEFLQLIAQHVEENDIEPPTVYHIRTNPNKTQVKLAILQQIDRKVPIEEIAFRQELEIDELLAEIETILAHSHGQTKVRVDINYAIEEIMDEDEVEEICDFFRNAPTNELKPALEHFCDDYAPEEIRMVRIKYLSEEIN